MILGVTGVGIISQLNNLSSFLGYFVPLGITNGLSKLVAERNISERDELKGILNSCSNLLIYPALIFSIAVFAFSKDISAAIFETADYNGYVKIIAASIPLMVANSVLEGYLRGLKEVGLYSRIITVSSLLNLCGSIPLIVFLGIEGAVYSIVFSFAFYIIISINQLLKHDLIGRPKFSLNFDKQLLGNLLKVSFVFLVSGALFQLSLMIIRRIIISDLGVFGVGIYQSVIGISLSYFSFIFLTLSTHSFPTVSKLFEKAEICRELNNNMKFILLLMVPLVLMLFIFRFFVIELLFSDEFFSGEKLFMIQFPGDLFKGLAWALGIWLVPHMKLRAFLAFEVLLNLNLVLILVALNMLFEPKLEWVSVSYLAAYMIHFLVNFLYARKKLQYKIGKPMFKILAWGLAFAAITFAVSGQSIIAGYVIAIPLLVAWIRISLPKSDLSQLLSYIRARFVRKSN